MPSWVLYYGTVLQRFSFIAGIMTALVVSILFFGSFSWKRSMHYGAPPERHSYGRGIAEQLGLTREELREELSQGRSMMEIAGERGIEIKLPPRWMNEKKRQSFLLRMADRLGIPVEELQQELSSGKRLLDIAEERGVHLTFPFPNHRQEQP